MSRGNVLDTVQNIISQEDPGRQPQLTYEVTPSTPSAVYAIQLVSQRASAATTFTLQTRPGSQVKFTPVLQDDDDTPKVIVILKSVII